MRSESFPLRGGGGGKQMKTNSMLSYLFFDLLLFRPELAFVAFFFVAAVANAAFRLFALASLSILFFSLHTLGTSTSPPHIPFCISFASFSASR